MCNVYMCFGVSVLTDVKIAQAACRLLFCLIYELQAIRPEITWYFKWWDLQQCSTCLLFTLFHSFGFVSIPCALPTVDKLFSTRSSCINNSTANCSGCCAVHMTSANVAHDMFMRFILNCLSFSFSSDIIPYLFAISFRFHMRNQ